MEEDFSMGSRLGNQTLYSEQWSNKFDIMEHAANNCLRRYGRLFCIGGATG